MTDGTVVLERDEDGRLLLRGPEGMRLPVRPVRLFPLTKPDGYISLLDHDEKELALIRNTGDLDPASRHALAEELAATYLTPRILTVYDIQEEFGVLQWHVRTDRGDRRFDMRGRDEVHHVGPQYMLLRDIDGNRFEIRDVLALDRRSQALVDAHL